MLNIFCIFSILVTSLFICNSILFSRFWIIYTIIWRRQWHPTPGLVPGKSHGQRSLVGYSPWGLEESDRTEQLYFRFSLSCIGKGNSNPLQCSCLENPRDGGTWWAAVYGVAQSQTRLKRLSSSSSSVYMLILLFQFISSSPFPVSACAFSTSTSLFCPVNRYIYTIILDSILVH